MDLKVEAFSATSISTRVRTRPKVVGIPPLGDDDLSVMAIRFAEDLDVVWGTISDLDELFPQNFYISEIWGMWGRVEDTQNSVCVNNIDVLFRIGTL